MPTLIEPFGYQEPNNWLALMIVRGTLINDLHYILQRIAMLDDVSLGNRPLINRTELLEIWPISRPLHRNPTACSIEPRGPGQSPTFCFWLPIGIAVNSIDEIYHRFDNEVFFKVEELAFNYFRIACPDNAPYKHQPANRIAAKIRNQGHDLMQR